nr:reverse transcriptase domain-containing protein [Tanacetum cinerariifolium]
QIRVKNIHEKVDSKLVANQVLGTYVAKEDNMIKYMEIVRGLVSGFTTFLISQVPRSKNKPLSRRSEEGQVPDSRNGLLHEVEIGMPTYRTAAVDMVNNDKELRLNLELLEEQMDLFSLIRAPNPAKVKTGSRPRAPHELPLLTLTAARVMEMDEPAVATDSSGVPSAIEKSPLDFADEAEASGRETAAPEMPPPEEVPVTTAPGSDQVVEAVVAGPPTARESHKRGPEGVDANAPSKSLRKDHTDRPSGIPDDVSDPDPLAFAGAPSHPPVDVAQSSQGVTVAKGPGSENASSPIEVLSPGSVYRPEWGVTNGSLLDTPAACQDLVDHVVPPGYFAELRHMPNDEVLQQYNVNLARQVAMGSQLRLRFEQEAKLLKKSVAQGELTDVFLTVGTLALLP